MSITQELTEDGRLKECDTTPRETIFSQEELETSKTALLAEKEAASAACAEACALIDARIAQYEAKKIANETGRDQENAERDTSIAVIDGRLSKIAELQAAANPQ